MDSKVLFIIIWQGHIREVADSSQYLQGTSFESWGPQPQPGVAHSLAAHSILSINFLPNQKSKKVKTELTTYLPYSSSK